MSDEHKAYASTAATTLEAHILSVHSAKNDAEWWAHKEILNLREELEKINRFYRETWFELRQLREDNKRLRAALKLCVCRPNEIAAAVVLKETGDD